MSKGFDRALEAFLSRWVDGARRRAIAVLALAAVATAAVLGYTASTLGINTNTADMISEDLPFRQAIKAYDRAFPQFVDTLIVVIDGDTPDLAEDAATALAARLEGETGVFKSVYLPGGGAFFTRHGLLYLDLDELAELADNLARVQPLLAALAEDPSVRGLFAELEAAIGEARDGAEPGFDLGEAFGRLSAAAEAVAAGRPYRLSWREVISGETATAADRRRIIVLQPGLEFSRLQPAAAALATVRRLAGDLGLAPEEGVRVRLTGSVALDHDQLDSARRGAGTAAAVSFVLVGAVLFAGLGSARLVAAALVTLLVGLIWTAGFAALAIGELNLISVAFAVLFIGLGIDFSIHMCLRYRELVRAGRDNAEAIAATGRGVGRALALCAVTTAAGFYAFVATDYAGVSELGLISGTGMFIALIANLTVLPALLALMPLPAPRGAGAGRGEGPAPETSIGRRRAVRLAVVAVALGAAAMLPGARFDFNPLNLHDPGAESVVTLRDLLAEGGGSPWALNVLAPSIDAAEALAARLEGLGAVDEAVTIADYVPDHQDEKLALIGEMAFFMGPPPRPDRTPPVIGAGERLAALDGLRSALDAWFSAGVGDAPLGAAARRLAAALEGVAGAARGDGGDTLERLERSLLAAFPERLRRLYAALEVAAPVTLDDLPRALVERAVTADGRVRVEVTPSDDVSGNAALRRFVGAVRAVAPDAVGHPVSVLESGDAVVRAFAQALASAIAVIVVLLAALTRRVSDTALVLSPLALAALLTGAATVALDIPFNFANVIVLPLLLGIGVDSAIHLVHHHRTQPPGGGGLLRTSTARAVVFSALTTIGSFASLTLSAHRGTASMGVLLTIGVGFTVICTLVVLPALLSPRPRNVAGPASPD